VKTRRLIHNLQSTNKRRRELRHNLTPAEALLWKCLKKSQVDGKKFRRQHSIGPFIADFYCPECRVIVELDGTVHSGILAGERDASRTEFLERFGIQVVRFKNDYVIQNREWVVEAIRAVLKDRA
jgi:very-short-patch-repair endonuclease